MESALYVRPASNLQNLVGEMESFSFDYSACKEAGLVQ
jgi:hypothetical protein